jgi:hypothetical protein
MVKGNFMLLLHELFKRYIKFTFTSTNKMLLTLKLANLCAIQMTASLSQGRMQTPNSDPMSPLYPESLGLVLIVQTNHLQWSSCIPFDHAKAIKEQILHKHGECSDLPSE